MNQEQFNESLTQLETLFPECLNDDQMAQVLAVLHKVSYQKTTYVEDDLDRFMNGSRRNIFYHEVERRREMIDVPRDVFYKGLSRYYRVVPAWEPRN